MRMVDESFVTRDEDLYNFVLLVRAGAARLASAGRRRRMWTKLSRTPRANSRMIHSSPKLRLYGHCPLPHLDGVCGREVELSYLQTRTIK